MDSFQTRVKNWKSKENFTLYQDICKKVFLCYTGYAVYGVNIDFSWMKPSCLFLINFS